MEHNLKSLLGFVDRYWWQLTFSIAIIITILSLYPVESLPSVPGTDKTHHFIAYGALAFPVALVRPQKWLLIIIGFLGYSGAIELVQPFVNRYAEWMDLAANSLGLILAILLSSIIRLLTIHFPIHYTVEK